MKRFTMLGLLALTTGCVHYMPVAVSSAPLGPKEHPVAVVSGEASAYYFMGFGPMGDDSLEAAVADAKGQKDSDTIMNVFVDRRLFCFPLCGFSLITQGTTRIYGTLVKYDDPWTKEHVLPSIHIGNAAQSSSASSDIKTFFNALSKGEMINISLKDGSTTEGAFQSISSDDVLWIRTGKGTFGSEAIALRKITRAEKIGQK